MNRREVVKHSITLNLDTPSNALTILAGEVLAFPYVACVRIRKTFDVHENLAVEDV